MILLGDFNESPKGKVRKNILSNFELVDPVELSLEIDQGTHHKFNGDNSQTSRIDWILSSSNFKCEKFEICKDHEGNLFPSDHFPVWGKFNL